MVTICIIILIIVYLQRWGIFINKCEDYKPKSNEKIYLTYDQLKELHKRD